MTLASKRHFSEVPDGLRTEEIGAKYTGCFSRSTTRLGRARGSLAANYHPETLIQFRRNMVNRTVKLSSPR